MECAAATSLPWYYLLNLVHHCIKTTTGANQWLTDFTDQRPNNVGKEDEGNELWSETQAASCSQI